MQTYFASIIVKSSKLLFILQRHISNNTKKKITVGQIVKRLNKENKALFGNLLESRSERRKTVDHKSHKSSATNDENNQVFPSKEQEQKEIELHIRPYTKTKRTRVSVASYCENKVSPKSDKHLPLKSSCDVVDKPLQYDSSAAIMPSVVLKSIKGFPLINRNKSVNNLYSLEHSETLLSRNKEYSKTYPSVSKILNATMSDISKMLLKKWREKMISELGEEGFLNFYKAQLNAGVQFHAAVQSYLRGASEDSLELDGKGVAGCWKSLSSVISEIDKTQVLEGPVVHSHLFYHGVLDCIASYQGEDVLIEWKKSDKPKPTLEKTYDAPIQLTAYMGAMNYDQNYPVQVNGGLVVIAYSDGSPADVFHLSLSECNKYWNFWLDRVHLFWLQQQENKKLSQESHIKE